MRFKESGATAAYDIASSRLQSVSDGTYSGNYGYLANSSLSDSVTFKQSSTIRMTTSRQYDYVDRLSSVSSAFSTVLSDAYHYNNANQRDSRTLQDGSYWTYGYDALGQINSGKKRFRNGIWAPGQQFEYVQDDIGNRSSTQVGGDSAGASLRSATYTPNNLNQYSSRSNPSTVDVIGAANTEATITVNGQNTHRSYEYYQAAVSVANTSPAYPSITNSATLGGSTTNKIGSIFVPPATESYTHDLDGNLVSDGRWTFTWDAENRLVSMVANSNVPSGAKKKLDFEYDWMGRRVGKKVYNWNGSAYSASPDKWTKFLYDGWNVVAELDGNNANAVIRTYMWGLDLSGTRDQAGGVGGLLLIKPGSGNPMFVAHDGNGNISGLVDATTGTTSAVYEYGPFGELIRMSGSYGASNPIRFSSKYADDESDLVYYGYRFYNPSTGRWLSRDPIQERGGHNLYGFNYNNPLFWFDILGREPSQLDQANEQFDEVMEEWRRGGGGGRHFGPNDPWTKELAKLPVYSRMRDEIRRRSQKACAGGTTEQLIGLKLQWDDSADDHRFTGPFRDAFKYVTGMGLKSTGSTQGEFFITSISCCPGEVCFKITVSDELRLGSATRIPGTSWSILPDVPSGRIPYTNINIKFPFEGYAVSWHWTECLQFAF